MLLLFCCYPCHRVGAQVDTLGTSGSLGTTVSSTQATPVLHPSPTRKRPKFLSLLWKADSLLTLRYRRINTDTTYVVRPQTKWVIKTRGNISGATFYMTGKAQGKEYEAILNTDVKGTLNLSVGYAGLSVGVSVNPASWAGQYKDYEFNLNSYSNLWGIDLIYHNQQSAGDGERLLR